MNASIINKRESMYNQGKTLYQIFLKNQKIWVDPELFSKDVVQINEESVTLAEPFEDYFTLGQKTNARGNFLTLLPAKNKKPINLTVNEGLPTYITKKTVKKQISELGAGPEDSDSSRHAEFAFIQKILSHPFLTKNQFEKIIDLTGRLFKSNEPPEVSEIDLALHKPQQLKKFLANFSSEGLKFLIHDFDVSGMQFEYQTVLDACEKYFKLFTSEYKLPKPLYSRIHNFAFNSHQNSFWLFNNKRYDLTWKNPEIKNWCIKNPGSSPINNDRFNQEMIFPFRQSIRIKNREFWPVIRSVLTKKLGVAFSDFTIIVDENQLNKADFYNDIEKLIKGLGTIFNTILERKDRSVIIQIDFHTSARRKYLTISHVGSKSLKPLNTSILSGDLHSAVQSFYQAYNYTIKAPYEGETHTLPLLYDIEHPEDEFINNYTPLGFTHIITL